MTSVNAQDEDSSGFAKSDIYMSGTVGFSSASQGDFDSSSFDFSPSVGYMMTDNLALEAGLSFSGDDNDGVETSTTGVAIGARYFMNPTSKFSLSIGASLAFLSSTESEEGFDDLDASGMAFVIAPAINYWISDSWGLIANIAALQYTTAELDIEGAEARTEFGLNVDLSDINFGMVYKF